MRKKTPERIKMEKMVHFLEAVNNSLLGEFIKNKLKSYNEPMRKGTPKGEKIGFTQKKYQASLFTSLTNFPLTELAKLFGISYGLLRKWKTEDDFKKVSDHHCAEFAEKIKKRLGVGIEIEFKARDAFLNRLSDEKIETDSFPEIYIAAPYFSKAVINKMKNTEREVLSTMPIERDDKGNITNPLDDRLEFPTRLCLELGDLVTYAQTGNINRNVNISVLIGMVSFAKDLLNPNRDLSEEERRHIYLNLSFVQNALEQLEKVKE